MTKITSLRKKAIAISISVSIVVIASLSLSIFGIFGMNPSESGSTRYEYEGAIIVSTIDLDKHEYKMGERIDIKPKLINVGNSTITILHGDPPFLIDVYSPVGTTAWSYPNPTLLVGQIAKLEPGVPYEWDEQMINERYGDIRLYFPGEYKIVSHSKFVIEEPGSTDLPKAAEVYSEPVSIRILP